MSFSDSIRERILVLDGAMGSLLQTGLSEREVLESYVAAGADIICTNSFSANRIVQADLGRAALAEADAYNAAVTARQVADAASQVKQWQAADAASAERQATAARQVADAAARKVYVAGSVGPTGKSLTLATDASDPTFRPLSFDELKDAYCEQMAALARGGADLLLIETCFDALNVKAAIKAAGECCAQLPLIISATVSDASGRTLTGQTLEAFYRSVEHAPGLAAFGINCALGAEKMSSLLKEVASFSAHPVIFYPNAGIPDAFGRYNDSPARMASVMERLASEGLLNIAGGCCGTTPAHIAAIAAAVRGGFPRKITATPPGISSCLHVSGLEAMAIDPSRNFTNIGERTNVAGSRKFARLIAAADYAAAVEVAAAQVAGGASIIDINMDDPMLDSCAAMKNFLRCISGEPAVAKAAIMIDSSHWDTIIEGLENAQGKCIVNSISLRDGEQEFIRRAKTIRSYGAAMVVMAFDERGQATDFARKVEICKRSYGLLTQAGIPPQEIIFDCNILSIGTGIAEHARFGVDFIEAVRWIKGNLPGALTSGGVSNLSFAFRGNDSVRTAMHSVFLYHAIKAGLDMSIVNPQMLQIYDDIEPELRRCVEDLIFDSDPGATARLIAKAAQVPASAAGSIGTAETAGQDSALTPEQLLSDAIVRGGTSLLAEHALKCLENAGSAVAVIEGPLMAGMERVGELFAGGKMFLPQVVKSAKVMRDAVAVLEPYMKSGDESIHKPKFLIATVQGDVHDIGKNITSIVLQCSGFQVIDLGVMVPATEILERAEKEKVDCIGVSGLITPSLHRMEELCSEMAARHMDIPLFVGGAAASAEHTALKLRPLYRGVHYCPDASATAVAAKKYLLNPAAFYEAQQSVSPHKKAEKAGTASPLPVGGYLEGKPFSDLDIEGLDLESARKCFNVKLFAAVCGIKGEIPHDIEAEAEACLTESAGEVKAAARFLDCHREGDCLVCGDLRLPMLRGGFSLADYFPEHGSAQLGLFAIKVGGNADGLVRHAARVSIAEGVSQMLQERWKSLLPRGMKLIAPGIGYPCCPDHSLKRDILGALPELGIKLTDSCAMIPEASICGLVIAHRDAAYRDITGISSNGLDAYAAARGMDENEIRLYLGHLI